MTAYFSVKDYETFQHYKDRNPPWIKLYYSLLGNYDYYQLSDASRSHLVAIYLLASRYGNKIPADLDWLKSTIHASENIDLDVLIKHDFIVPDEACSMMLAERKRVATQRREESERESKSSVPIGTGEAPIISIEKILFSRGKQILGPTGGGQITKLKTHFGGDCSRALECIELASAKENPAEYIGAVLRGGRRYDPAEDPIYRQLNL